MPSSLSTSSSRLRRRYRNYSVAMLGVTAAMMLMSLAALYWKPQALYWRAWEYFDDIGLREADPALWTWHGYEKGDLSRNYTFRYQDSWPTHVSVDAHGYRRTPCATREGFQILVQGESHIWASGLSDHETVPWRLSRLLDRPVFNGAKADRWLDKVLRHPRLTNVKIIVEATSSHLVVPGAYKDGFSIKPWAPRGGIDPVSRFSRISFKRYFLPAHAFRYLSFASDLWRPSRMFASEQKMLAVEQAGTGYSVPFKPEETEAIVTDIVAYARSIEALGYTYVFVPTPIMHFPNASVRADYYTDLVRELRAREIHAVDLHAPFWEHRDRGLHLRTDSHLSAAGAELAARTIADYLRNEGLLKLLPETSCALANTVELPDRRK